MELLQIQEVLPVSGGMTESVLKKSEAWLLAKYDHQEALHLVARRKKEMSYWSLMDFILCEIFLEHRNACFRFYAGTGPKLEDTVSKEELKRLDALLLKGLKVAYQLFRENRRMSWVKYRLMVLAAA